MKYKMLRTIAGSPDGVMIHYFLKDGEYTEGSLLTPSLIRAFYEMGAIEQVVEAKVIAAPETKPAASFSKKGKK